MSAITPRILFVKSMLYRNINDVAVLIFFSTYKQPRQTQLSIDSQDVCVLADARQFIRHLWRQIISRVWLARRRLTDICYSSSSSILQQQQQQQRLQLHCEGYDPHHSTDPFPSLPWGWGGAPRGRARKARTLIDKYTQTRTEIVIYIRYVAV